MRNKFLTQKMIKCLTNKKMEMTPKIMLDPKTINKSMINRLAMIKKIKILKMMKKI